MLLPAYLMALGLSIVLNSIHRFFELEQITEPILVLIIGAAGIGSNILMLLIVGGMSSRTGKRMLLGSVLTPEEL